MAGAATQDPGLLVDIFGVDGLVNSLCLMYVSSNVQGSVPIGVRRQSVGNV